LGVKLRPHLKTAKCVEIARLATQGAEACITVATVAEAEYFAKAGFGDITYAVGISARTFAALANIAATYGITLQFVVDNVTIVQEIARHPPPRDTNLGVCIEIDCGGGRGGVPAEGPELLAIAHEIQQAPFLTLRGVLTHAGQSYGAASVAEIRAIAKQERVVVTTAAKRLRENGFEIPIVSLGATPTAVVAESLSGVTEMRPGVYMLFDLDQVSLGICTLDDIAASVLTTVIGHNVRSKRMLIDAGGLALSKDLSANQHNRNVGFGLVCPLEGGPPIAGMAVVAVHQEHGFIAANESIEVLAQRYPAGTRLRILPNHVCMTAAPYDRYQLVRGESVEISGSWEKLRGW